MRVPGGVVFYHYTTEDNLRRILATQTILPSPPHPATPGRLAGSSLKDGAVFLTRMDPTNSLIALKQLREKGYIWKRSTHNFFKLHANFT